MWFITAGGAVFAAWPLVYASAFSGFYVALMLTLFALFLRPVGFDYRSKVADPRWRAAWDWGLFVGGTVPEKRFTLRALRHNVSVRTRESAGKTARAARRTG